MALFGPAGEALTRLLNAPQRRRDERDVAWSALALRHGGVFHAEQGPFVQGARAWRWQSPRAEFEVDEVLVRLELHLRSVGNTVVLYTRVQAGYVLGRGPKFRAFPATGVHRLAEKLGFEDSSTGDAAFDERFMLRAGDPEAVACWTPAARAAALRSLARSGAEVATDRRKVVLDLLGMVVDPEVLEAAAAMVIELASYGRPALDALLAVPGAAWSPATGAFGQRVLPHASLAGDGGEGAVVFQIGVVGMQVETSAVTPRVRDAGRFSFEVDANAELVWGELERLDEGLLGPEAARRVARLPGIRVRGDGRLVHVRMFESTSSRLRDAAMLARLLARGEAATGVFR